jgi:hypothetical protein
VPRPLDLAGTVAMTRSRVLAIGGGLLVAALLAAVAVFALGGGDDEVETASPTSTEATTTTTEATTTTTTAPVGPAAPLTGIPLGDAVLLARPALLVKIDNVDGQARPQAGLNQADVVYEEMVEGGVTRFAAVFHSQDASSVGPIRSARTTDISLATPLHVPLFSFSGANEDFMARVRAAPVVDLSYDWNPQLYTRVPDRAAPDNIFTPTATLYATEHPDSTTPPALFTYRGAGDDLPPDAVRVPGAAYEYGGAGAPVSFTWDADTATWRRDQNGTPHLDTDGEQLRFENVIVQFTNYVDTGYTDLAGTPVPEAELVGEGEAWVLTDGHLVPARWRRGSVEDVARFTTVQGDDVALTPGRTWVALALPGRALYQTCAEAVAGTPGC